MQITKASKKDIDAIYRLMCELENIEFDKDKFSQMFLSNLENENIYYYVAIVESKIVGFISLHIQNLIHHLSKIAEIQELIITEKSQELGIGKRLFNEAKQTAIENQCSIIEVCCNQKNKTAISFYLKQAMKNTHYKFTLDLK